MLVHQGLREIVEVVVAELGLDIGPNKRGKIAKSAEIARRRAVQDKKHQGAAIYQAIKSALRPALDRKQRKDLGMNDRGLSKGQ